MGKPYSMDLREWVVAAVAGGMTCNRAAKQFGIGISIAINWVKRLGETGSVAPGKMAGTSQGDFGRAPAVAVAAD
jgi:putative transposase